MADGWVWDASRIKMIRAGNVVGDYHYHLSAGPHDKSEPESGYWWYILDDYGYTVKAGSRYGSMTDAMAAADRTFDEVCRWNSENDDEPR